MKINPSHILSFFALSALAPASAAVIYSAGHGDIGIAYDGGLEPHVHLHAGAIVDGSPAAADLEFAPEDILIFVPNPSIARPAGAQWDLIGNSAGSPTWVLPQTEDTGKPWLGIASEELTPGDWTGPLTITLTGVDGPDQFSLFDTDSFGTPTFRMASGNGISSADVINHTAGSHYHGNYTFTEPGVYELTFQIAGTHTAVGPVSASATYTFGVNAVPEPSGVVLFSLTGMLVMLRRRRSASTGLSKA